MAHKRIKEGDLVIVNRVRLRVRRCLHLKEVAPARTNSDTRKLFPDWFELLEIFEAKGNPEMLLELEDPDTGERVLPLRRVDEVEVEETRPSLPRFKHGDRVFLLNGTPAVVEQAYFRDIVYDLAESDQTSGELFSPWQALKEAFLQAGEPEIMYSLKSEKGEKMGVFPESQLKKREKR